jgi:hypothetical protein
VAEQGIGLYEERTRVICHLPLNNYREEAAVWNVIGYLKEQRKLAIGGDASKIAGRE